MRIRVRDVRLGSNPIELLPEKSDDGCYSGVVQIKTSIKVDERVELSWSHRSFEQIVAVPKSSQVGGRIEDIPFVEACAVVRQSFSSKIFSRLDFGTVMNFIPTLPTIEFLFVGESHRATVKGGDSNIFAEDGLRTLPNQNVEFKLRCDQPSIRAVSAFSRWEIRHGVRLYPGLRG